MGIESRPEWINSEIEDEQNRESTPPDGERVQFHSVFAVELFGPSQIDNLAESLRKLGWGTEGSARHFPGDAPLDRQVVMQNRLGLGPGWTNVGLIVNPGQTGYLPQPLNAKLPEQVDVAHAQIHTVVPGLTALVIQFVLNDELGLAVDRQLRTERQTQLKERQGGFTFIGPHMQKRTAIEAEVLAVRSRCNAWMVNHFQGQLAKFQLKAGERPDAIVMSIDKGQIVDDDRRRQFVSHYHYIDFVLGIQGLGVSIFESPELKGLYLLNRTDHSESGLRFMGNTEDLFALSFQNGDRPTGRWELSYRLDNLGRAMAVWATHILLERLRERYSESKHSAIDAIDRRASVSALDALRNLERQLLLDSADAQVLTAELSRLASDHWGFFHDLPRFESLDRIQLKDILPQKPIIGTVDHYDFHSVPPPRHESAFDFFAYLWRSLITQGEWIAADDLRARELVQSLSALANGELQDRFAKSNDKTQKISIGIALIALIIACMQFGCDSAPVIDVSVTQYTPTVREAPIELLPTLAPLSTPQRQDLTRNLVLTSCDRSSSSFGSVAPPKSIRESAVLVARDHCVSTLASHIATIRLMRGH